MVRVRSGQAPAWLLPLTGVSVEVSGIKRDFACTFTRQVPPALVALRPQLRLMLEGRTRTLSGPSPDLSPARAFEPTLFTSSWTNDPVAFLFRGPLFLAQKGDGLRNPLF